jgi:hypothetical protein
MQKVRLPYWTLLVLKLLVYIDAGLFKAQFEEAQKTNAALAGTEPAAACS